jgi:predicted SprT family Zn-dependent metalloprotease
MAEEGDLFGEKSVPAGASPRSYLHPRSGKDAALTLVAADLAREKGLAGLADTVAVSWNPRMRTAAGRAFAKDYRIELNPRLQDLPEGQREAELRNTFLHELAHLIAFARAGRRRIQPHGIEWQQACHDLGIPGEDRCHALDFKPRRHARKYAYTCPHCRAVIERVRRLSRRVACYKCCRALAKGQFDPRFQLVESRLG